MIQSGTAKRVRDPDGRLILEVTGNHELTRITALLAPSVSGIYLDFRGHPAYTALIRVPEEIYNDMAKQFPLPADNEPPITHWISLSYSNIGIGGVHAVTSFYYNGRTIVVGAVRVAVVTAASACTYLKGLFRHHASDSNSPATT